MHDIDAVEDLGVLKVLFSNFSKKNKAKFLDYKNNQRNISAYFEEFKKKPTINIMNIKFNLTDLGNFITLSKKYPDSILYDYRFEDTIYLFSSFSKKDFVLKIDRYNNTDDKNKDIFIPEDPNDISSKYMYEFTLLDKNFNMQSSCSKFSVDNKYWSISIDEINSKCIKNNYTIDWFLEFLSLIKFYIADKIKISIINADYINEKSKNYNLINKLIKSEYNLLYDPMILLDLINTIDIKNILKNHDIKYSESLIIDNIVTFENYYNSNKNILMVKQLFQDIKNETMIHKIKSTTKDNISEIMKKTSILFDSIKSLFLKNNLDTVKQDFKNLQSYNISSLNEDELVTFIFNILEFIVDTPNYLIKENLFN
jgi:hypothetical protein